MPQINGTLLQLFHWYTPGDGGHWRHVASRAWELAAAGFTGVWLPPAFKGAAGADEVGYGVYDMYDLGEFDQKGSVRTKYGTKDEYLAAIRSLQAAGLQVLVDVVLNHRLGADATEKLLATPFHPSGRTHAQGDPVEVEVWTKFTFPGRNGVHSAFEWNSRHFDAVDYAANRKDAAGTIYLLEGHEFDDGVDAENGNFDFLLGCDVDLQSEEVRREIGRWAKWYFDLTNADGFRIDAAKHMSAWAFPRFVDGMRTHAERPLFTVSEYWSSDIQALHAFITSTRGTMSVFDVPLHFKFHEASRSGGRFDLRTLLDGTVMKDQPTLAVTFVDNHDSQPLQALESPVDPWFKPLAYAVILLRAEGYPCVFLADYDGATYTDRGVKIELPSHRFLLDRFLKARQDHAWGEQLDYFDHADCIGWTRLGDAEHPRSMAVILTDGAPGSKVMDVRRPNATFCDITGHIKESITADATGKATFSCLGGSVSVWVQD